MNEHTTAASLADALEHLAAELRKTPVAEFAAVTLDVNVQALQHRSGRADRYAAVDRLATVLQLGQPDESGHQYGARRESCGAKIDVYTATVTDDNNAHLTF